MQVARIAVIGIAVGSGLLAAMIAFRMSSAPPVEAPPPAAVAEAPKIEATEVLVVRRDIPIGTAIADADLTWEPWPKSDEVDSYITKTNRPNAKEEIAGSIARASFLAGEPIREARLVKAERGFMSVILSPGMRAIAIEVRAVGTAGGFILPSDHVDVILTHAAQKAPGPTSGAPTDAFVSETLLTNIKVLAIDQQIAEQKGETSVVAKNTVTLEVSPRQAEQVAQAQQLGTLSLILRPLRDAQVDAPVAADDNQTSSVRVVRFGQTTRTTAR
jgi:pilus assembly protein CpaB